MIDSALFGICTYGTTAFLPIAHVLYIILAHL